MHRPNIYDRLSQRREQQERLERERLEQEALKAVPAPRFLTNELSFVRPERLKDQTFQVFSMIESGPGSLSVVISRSPVEDDSKLEERVQQLLGEIDKSLSHLQWVEFPKVVKVAGTDARRLEFKWRQQGQPVHQIQFVFIVRDEYGLFLLMQITATSSSLHGMSLDDRQLFESIMQSVQCRVSKDGAEAGRSDE